MSPRDLVARVRDTLLRLEHDVDAWVATSGGPGDPPAMVPLSFHWNGDDILLATSGSSRAGRNMAARGAVRLALGTPRDVVLIDGVATEHPLTDIPENRWTAYRDHAGWDPRGSVGHRAYLVRPVTIQAWREADEQAGRTIMRDGRFQAQ